MTATALKEGDLVATVGIHGNRGGYSYHGTSVYRVEKRKADGKLVYIKQYQVNDTVAGRSKKTEKRAQAYAEANGMQYRAYARQHHNAE